MAQPLLIWSMLAAETHTCRQRTRARLSVTFGAGFEQRLERVQMVLEAGALHLHHKHPECASACASCVLARS